MTLGRSGGVSSRVADPGEGREVTARPRGGEKKIRRHGSFREPPVVEMIRDVRILIVTSLTYWILFCLGGGNEKSENRGAVRRDKNTRFTDRAVRNLAFRK